MRLYNYTNSEIADAIISALSNKHDRYVIYSRLVREELWRDLFIVTIESKRHYERLCSKVYKKLEAADD